MRCDHSGATPESRCGRLARCAPENTSRLPQAPFAKKRIAGPPRIRRTDIICETAARSLRAFRSAPRRHPTPTPQAKKRPHQRSGAYSVTAPGGSPRRSHSTPNKIAVPTTNITGPGFMIASLPVMGCLRIRYVTRNAAQVAAAGQAERARRRSPAHHDRLSLKRLRRFVDSEPRRRGGRVAADSRRVAGAPAQSERTISTAGNSRPARKGTAIRRRAAKPSAA